MNGAVDEAGTFETPSDGKVFCGSKADLILCRAARSAGFDVAKNDCN